jgi:nucleotide-binding universal stress UspA family protein
VVSHAVALAKCGHARVTLLRVVQPIPQIVTDAGVSFGAMVTVIDSPATNMLAETVEQQLRDETSRLHDETGLQFDSHVVVDSSVANAIISFAHRADADVVAMATHTSAVERTFLGSVADKVARGVRLPVLLYHPQAVEAHDSDLLTKTREVGHPFVVI